MTLQTDCQPAEAGLGSLKWLMLFAPGDLQKMCECGTLKYDLEVNMVLLG